ncbi:MAG: hypothetical protein K8I02_11835, partial [Candidatus Methylomirabilis sp.]|nr:hypothetical protein [Deltaproteobacteria bacterium]
MPEGGRATHVVRGIQPYRKLWHMSSVWAPLVYMHYVENRTAALEIAGGVLLFFFMIDLFRLTLPVGNDIAFRYFSAVIGDSERRNFNTSTYFVLGAFLTVLLYEKHIAVVALMFLSLGDPMGALIGSKYGSIKVFGKSLQGSLAVFLTCFIVGSFLIDPKLAFWGALCATMFELLSSKINDNVSIPLFSGLAMTLLTEKAELTDPLQVAFVVLDVYLVFVVVTSLVGQVFKHIITWKYRTDYPEMFARREGWAPSVTVIKPLKGASEGLEEDLASWFNQDYLGPVQIVFAVGSEADPAAALARELIAANPEVDARLVVAAPDERFPDRTNNILAGLRVARGEAILMSDAPVRAARGQI